MERESQAVERDAQDTEPDEPQVDPHYLELLRGTGLPPSYMPAVMPGVRPRWIRVSAAVIIAVLVTATSLGVCLTYGLPHL